MTTFAALVLLAGFSRAAAGRGADFKATHQAVATSQQKLDLKEIEDTIAKGGVYLGEEARANKILNELKVAEGAAAKELQGHPDLLRQEESLLHEAAARAGEARKAFGQERVEEGKRSALLAEHKKAASGHQSKSQTEVQTANGALLSLASGLESVAKDDQSVLRETARVEKLAKQALGDTAGARRVQALMSKAEAFERKVYTSDMHEFKEARKEAAKLSRPTHRHPRSAAVKFNKEATTPEGFKVGSDQDIENEVDKMMAQEEEREKRREVYNSMHAPGAKGKDNHKLSMTAQAKKRHNVGTDVEHEAKVDSHRVELRDRAEETVKRVEAENLGLQKQRGQKHRVHDGRVGRIEQKQTEKSYAELSRERRRQAKLSRDAARQKRAVAQEKELTMQARDHRLLHELSAVRRDLVRELRDGNQADYSVAQTENRLIREAERVLEEARVARKKELPIVALSQHGSHVKEAHKEHLSTATMAKKGAAMALRASKEAAKEVHMEKKILHETKFAEEQIDKLLQGEGAEKIKKLVMQDLEKAQHAEKQAIKAETKEAQSSRRAAKRLAKEAHHSAAHHA